MANNDRWRDDQERNRYRDDDRSRSGQKGYGRGSDYEGDGTIARRGFGNESAGYDRDDRSDDWRRSRRGTEGIGDIDAAEIEVSVSNCEVMLAGTVDSREAKRRAEDCAESVSGVNNVQNNLRVQPQSTNQDTASTGLSGVQGGSQEASTSHAGRRKTGATT